MLICGTLRCAVSALGHNYVIQLSTPQDARKLVQPGPTQRQKQYLKSLNAHRWLTKERMLLLRKFVGTFPVWHSIDVCRMYSVSAIQQWKTTHGTTQQDVENMTARTQGSHATPR